MYKGITLVLRCVLKGFVFSSQVDSSGKLMRCRLEEGEGAALTNQGFIQNRKLLSQQTNLQSRNQDTHTVAGDIAERYYEK